MCVCVGVSLSVYVLVRVWVSSLFVMGDLMGLIVGVLTCLCHAEGDIALPNS